MTFQALRGRGLTLSVKDLTLYMGIYMCAKLHNGKGKVQTQLTKSWDTNNHQYCQMICEQWLKSSVGNFSQLQEEPAQTHSAAATRRSLKRQ